MDMRLFFKMTIIGQAFRVCATDPEPTVLLIASKKLLNSHLSLNTKNIGDFWSQYR